MSRQRHSDRCYPQPDNIHPPGMSETVLSISYEVMQKMKIACVCALSSLLMIAGCSVNPNSSITTVHAQSAYSNASFNGTYAFSLINVPDQNGGAGTIVLDGNGNITGGSQTEYYPTTSVTCVYNLSGTYSIQSSGAGTASLTGALNAALSGNGCNTSTFTMQLALEGAGSGSAFEFVSTSGIVAGTAAKQ